MIVIYFNIFRLTIGYQNNKLNIILNNIDFYQIIKNKICSHNSFIKIIILNYYYTAYS